MSGKRIGFIGILIEDRVKSAGKVNTLLSDFGEKVLARVGLPCRDKGVHVITLVVDATTDEVGALTGKLGSLEGVSVKSALAK